MDVTLEYRGAKVKSVKLLEDGQPLEFKVEAGVVKISLPVVRQSKKVDVVRLDLENSN